MINPGASHTGDVMKLTAIKLTSIGKGSYSNFIQLFKKTAAYIKIDKKPLKDELKYDFLINGISHDAYLTLITSIQTKIPPLTYAEVQTKLLLHADAIEHKTVARQSTCSISNVKQINGYNVDEQMQMPDNKWELLTPEQRKAFVKKQK